MLHHSKIKYLAYLALLLVYQPLVIDAQSTQWQKIATGMQLTRVPVKQNSFLSPEVLLVKVALNYYDIAVITARQFGQTRASVKQLSKDSQALLGINANFFDESGKALGLVISKGIQQQKIHRGGQTLTGIFQISKLGAKILARHEYNHAESVEAIQAGPRLINQNKLIPGLKNEHLSSRRSGVCTTNDNQVIFYISSGFIGITISDLQNILVSNTINCTSALNLDGGGSAQFFLSNKLPGANSELTEINIHGTDNIPVMLGVFRKRVLE